MLGAFRHRDFRLFWGGQLVSLIGTWMQSVGQSWLVLELTGSPLQLGLVNALQFTPILLLSPVGGALSDRLGKRRILLVTQAAMVVQALVLALLVRSGHVRYWHVALLATIYGLGRAIDIPARQAFITDLVGRPDLPNAVALNSVVFNGARIVGPGVAGLLIARFDVAMAFFLNAASFVAVLAALLAMRTEGHPDPAGQLGIRQGLIGALSYAVGTPQVSFTLALLVAVSLLGLNFNVVVPLIARDVLHEGAQGFGLLMSALGVGAVIGAGALALLRRDRCGIGAPGRPVSENGRLCRGDGNQGQGNRGRKAVHVASAPGRWRPCCCGCC
jgi:MFS family permease